jgi:hypothetical protein
LDLRLAQELGDLAPPEPAANRHRGEVVIGTLRILC